MSHPAIEVTELAKTYRSKKDGAVRALDGVSFEVSEGRIFGLLGPNGAGKSTLVNILGTITAPTSGRATVGGCDVATQGLPARRQMAVVLQQTAAETLLTVKDNLQIYGYLHGLSRADSARRAAAVAEEFELGARLKDTVQDLSLGTRRRIQVAKVFMLDTPVLILDEATTGMDPLMKRRVMERLRAEARKGRTVLLTTQVLSEAEQLCDHIVILHRGKTLASGTLDELRRLSSRLFRVSLSFGEIGADVDLEARLRALAPAELKVEGRKAEMTFEGEETALLGHLADIARVAPILQFEVRGPDLEEIFVTLLQEAR
jgi:ABC-2 type transport system ATP-binding protein